jgi:hypothetical protein
MRLTATFEEYEFPVARRGRFLFILPRTPLLRCLVRRAAAFCLKTENCQPAGMGRFATARASLSNFIIDSLCKKSLEYVRAGWTSGEQ